MSRYGDLDIEKRWPVSRYDLGDYDSLVIAVPVNVWNQ